MTDDRLELTTSALCDLSRARGMQILAESADLYGLVADARVLNECSIAEADVRRVLVIICQLMSIDYIEAARRKFEEVKRTHGPVTP